MPETPVYVLKSLPHRLKKWEKKRGWISWSKEEDKLYLSFFPDDKFVLDAFGQKSSRKVDAEHRRLYVGAGLKTNPEAVPGATLQIEKVADHKYKVWVDTSVSIQKIPVKADKHQRAIEKWMEEEKSRFGEMFQPEIQTGTVDINQILPKTVQLEENKKFLDGLARLEIGGQPFYQSVLEVQHKGMREDLVVRIRIVLPFITRADIIAGKEDLQKIRELLECISDPNILKARVKFYTFEKYLED